MGDDEFDARLAVLENRVRQLRGRTAGASGAGFAVVFGLAAAGAGLALLAYRAEQRSNAPIAWGPLGTQLKERLAKHDRRFRSETETLATQLLPALGQATAETWSRDGRQFAVALASQSAEFRAHLEADLPPLLAEHHAAAVKAAVTAFAAETPDALPAANAARLADGLASASRRQALRRSEERLRQPFAAAAAEWGKAAPAGPPQGEQLPTGWHLLGQVLELLLQSNAQPEAVARPALAGEPTVVRPTRPPKPITPPIAGQGAVGGPPGGAPKSTPKKKGP